MLMASVQQPPEDAWKGVFLSFTFSFLFFFFKENSSAFYFTTTIAWTGSFKCFKSSLRNLYPAPWSFQPALSLSLPSQQTKGRDQCQAPGCRLLSAS